MSKTKDNKDEVHRIYNGSWPSDQAQLIVVSKVLRSMPRPHNGGNTGVARKKAQTQVMEGTEVFSNHTRSTSRI